MITVIEDGMPVRSTVIDDVEVAQTTFISNFISAVTEIESNAVISFQLGAYNNTIAPASSPLGGHRVVMNAIDGRLAYASNDIAQSAYTILGITLGAATENALVEVQSFGLLAEPSWAWTPNLPIYLGTNGLLTQTMPTAPTALFSLVLGFAISATSIFLNLHEAIYIK